MATLHPGTTYTGPDFVEDSKIQRVTRFPAAADFRSPVQPPAGLDSWQVQSGNFRAPPPYETPQTGNVMETQGAVGGYQPSQNWAYDASRVAAQNAFAKQKRMSSHLNKSRSKRRNKPFGQTMRPAIAVDTSYSRHRGPAPRQVFPAAVGGLFAAGKPGMVPPEDEKAPSKFKWLGLAKSASIRKLRSDDRKESLDKLAPTYELQEKESFPVDDGFRFKSKTMRRNAPEVKSETKPVMVPFVPGPPSDPPVAQISVPETPETTQQPRMSPLDVSPSDRPITVGLTVSPEQVSDYDTPQSAQSGNNLGVHPANHQRSNSPGSAETPTIIVTPAREKSGWLFPMDNRPRPASSVYSRATNAYTMYNPSREHIPPVPAIPANFETRNDNSPGGISTANGFVVSESPSEPAPPQPAASSKAQEIANTKKPRVTSDATLFEEDQTPQSAGTLRGPTGLYIDTNIPPTPHRSKGWWNIITTPFEFTPSRFRFAPGTPSDASTPMIPMILSRFSRSPDLHRNFSARSRAAQTPQSSTTAFSPATWERSSSDESPVRTHDDLGISTVPSRESLDRSYQPEGAQSAISASDREIPVALGPGFEAKADSPTNPAPPSHNNSNNVFHLSNHYHFNGVPFYRDRDFVRSDTLRSTDTTPVVAVASLGTVLSARAVHEPHDPTSTPRSMNAYVEDAPAEPRAAAAAATPRRSTSTRRSSRPHDISMPAPAGVIPSSRRTSADVPVSSRRTSSEIPQSNQRPAAGFLYSNHRAAEAPYSNQREQAPAPYSNPPAPAAAPYFPPPPTQVHHHHHQQNNYFTQDPPSYGSPDETLERGGTRRPFPGSPHYTEKVQKAPKAPKAPRRKGAGGYWHLFPKRNHAKQDPNDPAAKKKKKRRCCCWCCCIFFLILLIIMAALLGTLLPRRHSSDGGSGSTSSTGGSSTSPDGSPSATNVPDTPSVWLNLTGFPPIPTGVATIAQPDNNYEESGCVSPQTMWSCAVPKEQQQELEPNEPNQPNFKFQIKFVNGTISNTTALQPTKVKRSIQQRRWLNFLRTRDEPTPSPSAPSREDQAFLGNTTDGNSSPFAGEDTPFFISFLNGEHVSSKRLAKRQSSTNGTIADIIPDPDIASDGTAAAANLLFFPANQPLKLYNRGTPTEHYGFYNYFDRSIFLKNNIAVNSTDTGEIQADRDGGSTKDAAKVRCTWRQTRYLVQIWTNSEDSKALLPTSTSSGASSTTSSAVNFDRPGSFPYPVTITLDRHGGNITEKMIYCYGMDDEGRIIDDSAKLQLENRDFSGTLVNPASGPFGNVNVTLAEGGPGGIDGGTGGCGCKWRNWENA